MIVFGNVIVSGSMYCAVGSTLTFNCNISGNYYIWLSGWYISPCPSLTGQESIGYITNYFKPPKPSIISLNDSISCGKNFFLVGSNEFKKIYWYKSSCSGSPISTGDTLYFYNLDSPGNVTIFYARNYYNNAFSDCDSIMIYSNFAPPPTSISSIPTQVSCGDSVILNAISPAYSVEWYDSFSNNISFDTSASGENIIIFPTQNTTYYAKSFSGGTGNHLFNFTGTIQYFLVPKGIFLLNIDATGAQGFGLTSPGGLGGRVQTNLKVSPGQLLYIFVGEQGLCCDSGGWNGGAFSSYSITNQLYNIGTGGGASDIRIISTALSNRIIVAGGGGGGGYDGEGAIPNSSFYGGNGGGLTGGNGSFVFYDTVPQGGAYGGLSIMRWVGWLLFR